MTTLRQALTRALETTSTHGAGCGFDSFNPCDCWRADAYNALEQAPAILDTIAAGVHELDTMLQSLLELRDELAACGCDHCISTDRRLSELIQASVQRFWQEAHLKSTSGRQAAERFLRNAENSAANAPAELRSPYDDGVLATARGALAALESASREPVVVPVCEHCDCGKPATCIGRYETMTEPAYACDECCGHGCEDGECYPLDEPNPWSKREACRKERSK